MHLNANVCDEEDKLHFINGKLDLQMDLEQLPNGM